MADMWIEEWRKALLQEVCEELYTLDSLAESCQYWQDSLVIVNTLRCYIEITVL